MKSFINYSKNRFFYGLMKFLILFLICFLFFALHDKAHAADYTFENIGYMNDNSTVEVIYDDYSSTTMLTPNTSYNFDFVDAIEIKINYGFSNGYVYNLEFYTSTGSLNSSNIKPTINYNNTLSCVVLNSWVDSTNYYKINFTCPESTSSITVNLDRTGSTSILNGSSIKYANLYLRRALTGYEEDILNQNQQIIDGQGQIKDELGQVGENIQGSIEDSTNDIKDKLDESFNTCRNSYNLYSGPIQIALGTSSSSPSGAEVLTSSSNYVGFYLKVSPGQVYSISRSSISTSRFRYAFTKELPVNHTPAYRFSIHDEALKVNNILVPEEMQYIVIYFSNSGERPNDFQIQEGSVATEYEPYGEEICSNKLDDTNQAIGDLNQNITSTTPPNLDSLSNSAGWLPPGPVDSIINLPLSLLNNLNDNLGGTCQSFVGTLPFVNKQITLPCMSTVYEKIGISAWVNGIGTVAAAFIAYYYLLELYKWVDNVLTLRENQWNDVDQWGGI